MLAKVKAKASELLAEGLAEKALEKYSELIKTGQGWSGIGVCSRKRLCYGCYASLKVGQNSANYQVMKSEHLSRRQWVTTSFLLELP